MPKPYTFPTLYDSVSQLDISNLKEWDYLNDKQIKTGTVNWSIRDKPTNSVTITVNTDVYSPFLELNYNYKGKPIRYRVLLVSIPSNIGNGQIWYFVCPKTLKKCRKLYLVDGFFLHREAVKGCLYETQRRSKKEREIEKYFGDYFKKDKNYELLYSKHFKKYYNGRPTKRYSKILKEIKEAEKISYEDILSALML